MLYNIFGLRRKMPFSSLLDYCIQPCPLCLGLSLKTLSFTLADRANPLYDLSAMAAGSPTGHGSTRHSAAGSGEALPALTVILLSPKPCLPGPRCWRHFSLVKVRARLGKMQSLLSRGGKQGIWNHPAGIWILTLSLLALWTCAGDLTFLSLGFFSDNVGTTSLLWG